MHIGVVGMGKMGSAIARRLLGVGHRVSVWNRTPGRDQTLVDLGARRADSPAQLAAQAEIVITILTDATALEAVYFGADGLLAGSPKRSLFVDMSTVMPAQQRAIGERVEAAGSHYLECPVGGSVGPAAEGKLLGFVGGSDAALARARTVLEQLCRRVDHLGPLGAGSTMKLAINLPLMVYWQTLGEALSLIAPLQLDPKQVMEIVAETSGAPAMLKVRGPMIARALAGDADAPITVNLATMRKDVRAMLEQAALGNVDLPLTALALQCFDRAADAGLDGADCTQLPVWWLAQAKPN